MLKPPYYISKLQIVAVWSIYIDWFKDDLQCHIPFARWCSLWKFRSLTSNYILSANVFIKMSFDTSFLFFFEISLPCNLVKSIILFSYIQKKHKTRFGNKKSFCESYLSFLHTRSIFLLLSNFIVHEHTAWPMVITCQRFSYDAQLFWHAKYKVQLILKPSYDAKKWLLIMTRT